MAGRNKSKGVEYFQHDTKQDGKTIYTLEAMYGNDGYAFWFKLLEILGQQENLYYDCNIEQDWMFLVARTRVPETAAVEILNLLSALGAIDAELWKYKIIWTQKYADRLESVYKKRGTEIPLRPNFCDGNTAKQDISDTEMQQGEESIGEKGKKRKKRILAPDKIQYADDVYMTEKEHATLVEKYGEAGTKRMIEILDNYKGANGKKYDSDYKAILNWVVDRWKEEQQKLGRAAPNETPPEYKF
jgi:hypothetical protein